MYVVAIHQCGSINGRRDNLQYPSIKKNIKKHDSSHVLKLGNSHQGPLFSCLTKIFLGLSERICSDDYRDGCLRVYVYLHDRSKL
jgi:hypothetical protein